MLRIQKGKEAKQNNDKGSAMIVALVVSVIIMVLCLSLIMITYTLFVQTSRKSGQAQCKVIAQTFAESFEKEIEDADSTFVRYLNERIQTTIPERYWCAVDSTEENDPMYSEDATSELNLVVNEIEGYTIFVSMTYELAENSNLDTEPDPGFNPEGPGASPSDPGDSGVSPGDPGASPSDPGTDPGTNPSDPSTDVLNNPRATIVIKCIKGSEDIPDPLYYATTIQTFIPMIDLSTTP